MNVQIQDQLPTQGNHITQTKGYELLKELALNLRWSWKHGTDRVWRELDPVLWELTYNPWAVLQAVSREKLKSFLDDPANYKMVEDHVRDIELEAQKPEWFQKKHPQSPLTCAAYFSMEFMLAEALPIYSGGLGNVAGDQLKAASDNGIPVVAVGLLYQQGYFRQIIDKEGNQQALYPYNDPGQLPIRPLRKSNGEWLRLEVALPGYSLWVRAWEVKVGRVTLYLLDTNDIANYPVYRGITSELYGGGTEIRLQQEIILGIGGWRLLRTLGLNPEVCHLNEGHAAFVILERALDFMLETGKPFKTALEAIRPGNLFTTHTAVPAGFDQFSPDLLKKYLTTYVQDRLKISFDEFLALGKVDPNNPNELFNMAYLAIRGSCSVNAVSKLHGKVSQDLFKGLFPRWPQDEIPIGSVTNGVHMPSWDSREADSLWTEACGKSCWKGELQDIHDLINSRSDADIWNMRNALRQKLVLYLRKQLTRILEVRGAPQDAIDLAKNIFDPNVLTLGFARRFATYKRPNMLLQDEERLVKMLANSDRPMQLIIAGKAHPEDVPGQLLIKQWINFIQRSEGRKHVIYLSDYDMHITEQLVQGVDIWINTPRRPWEACGTSGMKVLVNGGMNVSELDGWWAEAYTPEVGWALGDGKEHGNDPAIDKAEANDLYNILGNEVAPLFYERDHNGMPTKWIAKIRSSMTQLACQYSATRAVREYTEKYYIPAAKLYKERNLNDSSKAEQIAKWRSQLDKCWSGLRFGEMKTETVNQTYEVDLYLFLNEIDPNNLKVELYAQGSPAVIYEMQCTGPIANKFEYHLYKAKIPANRPINDFSARIVPYLEDVAIPLEANHILWQR